MLKKYWFEIFAVILIFATAFLWWHEASASTIGFYSHEVVNGLNKICYYDTPQGLVAITVKSYELCPVTIRVP